jgi:predicted nucleic acid-binding protein
MNRRDVPVIDTDIIIRLVTGDDPVKQERARALFKEIESGRLTVAAPVTVIADCVFVLTSPGAGYALSNVEAVGLLLPIVRLSHLKIPNRKMVLRALNLCANRNIDFGDAYLVATLEQIGSNTVYSYDRDFDRLKGIVRKEP